jgi:hypothetical protein
MDAIPGKPEVVAFSELGIALEENTNLKRTNREKIKPFENCQREWDEAPPPSTANGEHCHAKCHEHGGHPFVDLREYSVGVVNPLGVQVIGEGVLEF